MNQADYGRIKARIDKVGADIDEVFHAIDEIRQNMRSV